MARIYPGARLEVDGYVKEVTWRGDFATLHVEVPEDSYVNKRGDRKKVPAFVLKFDVTDAFMEAITQYAPASAVTVKGKASPREWTPSDGATKVFVSYRMTDLKACNDLPVIQPPMPPAPEDDQDVPF